MKTKKDKQRYVQNVTQKTKHGATRTPQNLG